MWNVSCSNICSGKKPEHHLLNCPKSPFYEGGKVGFKPGDIVQAHNGLGRCEIVEGPLYRLKATNNSAEYLLKEDEFHLLEKKK